MIDWSVTHGPEKNVLRLRLPKHVSTGTARAAITELVNEINAMDRPCVIVADLLAIHPFDADAPVMAARVVSPAVGKIEHVYILTDSPLVRSAASAAATSVGLRFSCHSEEPALLPAE